MSRRARRVGQADVERRADRVVADVRRVVAGGAGADQAGGAERVVEPADASDRDRVRVEQRLAAGHARRLPPALLPLWFAHARRCRTRESRTPRPAGRHRARSLMPMWNACATGTRATLRARRCREAAGVVVIDLRGEQRRLEVDDRLALRCGERCAPARGPASRRSPGSQVRSRSSAPGTVSRPSHMTVLGT